MYVNMSMNESDIKCVRNEGVGNTKGKRRGIYLLLMLALGLVTWFFLYKHLLSIAKFLTYRVMGFTPETHLGSSVEFFIFEVPKVLMLLVLVIFGVGIVRSFFSAERTRKILAGKSEFVGNIFAAGLGIVTPFCTCSAVPLFIGFVEAGVPLGVTLSFLIAAPMINEIALVLLADMFGWRVAGIYLATGLMIAIAAGWVIGRLKMERFVEDWVYTVKMGEAGSLDNHMTWQGRVEYALTAVRDIVKKVWLFIVIGIGVGAGIHGYVPAGQLASIMGSDAWWSVPAAVLIGVPMYSNAAGIVPVMHVLMEKGAALGTALAFMMAVIGLSLPECIILRKVLKKQLVAVFVAVVATGILIVGYLFNGGLLSQ